MLHFHLEALMASSPLGVEQTSQISQNLFLPITSLKGICFWDALLYENVSFFYKVYRRRGVKPLYKKLCSKFCIVLEAFWQHKWTLNGLLRAVYKLYIKHRQRRNVTSHHSFSVLWLF